MSRVLIINTGGTIGMKPTPEGLAPHPHLIEEIAQKMPMLHDKECVFEHTCGELKNSLFSCTHT